MHSSSGTEYAVSRTARLFIGERRRHRWIHPPQKPRSVCSLRKHAHASEGPGREREKFRLGGEAHRDESCDPRVTNATLSLGEGRLRQGLYGTVAALCLIAVDNSCAVRCGSLEALPARGMAHELHSSSSVYNCVSRRQFVT